MYPIPMRLDVAIATRHPHLSRRKARELIAAHRVLVNERPVAIASREVKESDRIVIVDALPAIDVIRETADWIAVNKPAGLAVQPDRQRRKASLEELLRLKLKEKGSPQLYLVHRIDAATSGVVIFARSQGEAGRLSELFANREVRKVYLAIVEGSVSNQVIDTPVREKSAITRIQAVRDLGTVSEIEVEIETGRTHQIRVHLASIGHPVVGDRRYGSTVNARRLMLHAWKLEHPSIGSLEATPPGDFDTLCHPEPATPRGRK